MKRHPHIVRLLIATVMSITSCGVEQPVYQPEGFPCAGGEKTAYIGGSWITSYQAAIDNKYSHKIVDGVYSRLPGQVIVFNGPDTSIRDGEWNTARESKGVLIIGDTYMDFGEKPIQNREFCVDKTIVYQRYLGPRARR